MFFTQNVLANYLNPPANDFAGLPTYWAPRQFPGSFTPPMLGAQQFPGSFTQPMLGAQQFPGSFTPPMLGAQQFPGSFTPPMLGAQQFPGSFTQPMLGAQQFSGSFTQPMLGAQQFPGSFTQPMLGVPRLVDSHPSDHLMQLRNSQNAALKMKLDYLMATPLGQQLTQDFSQLLRKFKAESFEDIPSAATMNDEWRTWIDQQELSKQNFKHGLELLKQHYSNVLSPPDISLLMRIAHEDFNYDWDRSNVMRTKPKWQDKFSQFNKQDFLNRFDNVQFKGEFGSATIVTSPSLPQYYWRHSDDGYAHINWKLASPGDIISASHPALKTGLATIYPPLMLQDYALVFDKGVAVPMSDLHKEVLRGAFVEMTAPYKIKIHESDGDADLQLGIVQSVIKNASAIGAASTPSPAHGIDTLGVMVNLSAPADTREGIIGNMPQADRMAHSQIDESLSVGSLAYAITLQEIAHVLGVSDPENQALADQPGNAGYNSIASYNSVAGITSVPAPSSSFQSQAMFDDLLLKYMYGADSSYHGGNTTYTFNNNNGLVHVYENEYIIDILGDEVTNSAPSKIYRHIMDNNGVDTIDASALLPNRMFVDLRPGHWSIVDPSKLANLADSLLPPIQAPRGVHDRMMADISAAKAPGNFSIPINFDDGDDQTDFYFENAITADGNDYIVGNDKNNFINGNGGVDIFAIEQGLNNITVYKSHSPNKYYVTYNNSDQVDILLNIENIANIYGSGNTPWQVSVGAVNSLDILASNNQLNEEQSQRFDDLLI